jgi:hypothetical protein
VHVAVPLLAAEAEHVEPLGRDDIADGFADPVDDGLERDVLVAREVARHLLPMLPGRHENRPVEDRIRVQERDRGVVLVDDVVPELRVSRDELADEAAAPEPIADVGEADGPAPLLRHGRLLASRTKKNHASAAPAT